MRSLVIAVAFLVSLACESACGVDDPADAFDPLPVGDHCDEFGCVLEEEVPDEEPVPDEVDEEPVEEPAEPTAPAASAACVEYTTRHLQASMQHTDSIGSSTKRGGRRTGGTNRTIPS